MKVSTLAVALALLILLGSIIFATSKLNEATANSTAPPVARTGAPGDGGTCVSCHSGASGTGNLIMSLADSPTGYVPGATDTLVILITDPGEFRWGFEVTALKNSDDTMAGTLSTTADLATMTGVATSGGRTYVGHRSNGASLPFDPNDGTFWGVPGAAGWLVEWTAPPQGTGNVTFYASGVAANGDGLQGAADTTYTATLTVQELATSPVNTTTWGKIKTHFK